jgi:hypothetical protein
MKLSRIINLIVLVIFVMGATSSYSQNQQSKNISSEKHNRAPYRRVMEMNGKFVELVKNHPTFIAPKILKEPAKKLNPILDDASSKYLLALITVTGNHLNITFQNSDANGNPKPSSNSSRQGREHKHTTSANQFTPPIGLKAFPSIIRMDKDSLKRLGSETTCMYYLFYPSIEDGWTKKGNLDSHDPIYYTHFTIAVLGSASNSDQVNAGHTDKAYKTNKSIDGEETWPYDNFTWYQ